jgi:hypothetical protein
LTEKGGLNQRHDVGAVAEMDNGLAGAGVGYTQSAKSDERATLVPAKNTNARHPLCSN